MYHVGEALQTKCVVSRYRQDSRNGALGLVARVCVGVWEVGGSAGVRGACARVQVHLGGGRRSALGARHPAAHVPGRLSRYEAAAVAAAAASHSPSRPRRRAFSEACAAAASCRARALPKATGGA